MGSIILFWQEDLEQKEALPPAVPEDLLRVLTEVLVVLLCLPAKQGIPVFSPEAVAVVDI
jgi:hypothetical protein